MGRGDVPGRMGDQVWGKTAAWQGADGERKV